METDTVQISISSNKLFVSIREFLTLVHIQIDTSTNISTDCRRILFIFLKQTVDIICSLETQCEKFRERRQQFHSRLRRQLPIYPR